MDAAGSLACLNGLQVMQRLTAVMSQTARAMEAAVRDQIRQLEKQLEEL